jgi:hypothetical protein
MGGQGKDSLAPISAPSAVTNEKATQRPSQTQEMAFCVMRSVHDSRNSAAGLLLSGA